MTTRLLHSKPILAQKLWIDHILWICQNILPLNDKHEFRNKDVGRIRDLVSKPKEKTRDELAHLLQKLVRTQSAHYVAPMLTPAYVQHVQSMSTRIYQPMIENASNHLIYMYYDLGCLLRFLDMNIHNSLFYSCMNLLQKYHSLARDELVEDDFADHYLPFVQDVLQQFQVVQKLVESNFLNVPPEALRLWQQDAEYVQSLLHSKKSE